MSNSNGKRNGNGARNGIAARNGASMPPLETVLKGRRILLTGATGFLGKVFLAILLRAHPEIERVYLLIRGDRRSSQNRFRREILDSPVLGPLREHLGDKFDRFVEEKIVVVPGDITDDGLLSEEAKPFKPGSLDAVVHSAGLVNFEASLQKAIEVNTIGVANVLAFARKFGAAMMHVSTCYAAGSADGHRYEDDLPADWCPNGRKSFRLEREIREALAAIDRVEAESRAHFATCPRRRRGALVRQARTDFVGAQKLRFRRFCQGGLLLWVDAQARRCKYRSRRCPVDQEGPYEHAGARRCTPPCPSRLFPRTSRVAIDDHRHEPRR